MQYFSSDFLDFFKELAPNNNKDWFDINRKRYKDSVKDPFDKFVTDLIERIHEHDKKIEITYKEAVFRINRDIRFSKDKSPYKLNRSAIISPKGRKDKSFPGLYLEINPEFYRIYGGVYQPDKEQLYNIREEICKNPGKLKKLVDAKEFQKYFGEIRGEKNKIIPKEFKDLGEKHPIIYHKQFYWFTELEPEVVLTEELMDKTIEIYLANKKLMDYFAKAIS